jgi:hypothetical protein
MIVTFLRALLAVNPVYAPAAESWPLKGAARSVERLDATEKRKRLENLFCADMPHVTVHSGVLRCHDAPTHWKRFGCC